MTQKDIICMARKARMPYFYGTWEIVNVDGLKRFAALVAAYEREECAKIANEWQTDVLNPQYHCDCATAIRAREEK
jgi:hypothetical protein